MEIVVFSSNRSERALTPTRLPPSLAAQTLVLVPHGQGAAYHAANLNGASVEETPEGVTGIARRRQWWLEHTPADKLMMLDDDLRFDTRRTDDTGKFLVATEAQVERLFEDVERKLDDYLHLTVTPREGGNFKGGDGAYSKVGRAMRVHGLRPKLIRGLGCRYDDAQLPMWTVEDFHMTLQLLRKGHPNLIVNYMVQGQGSSNAPGGCATYRTPESIAAGVRRLAELHRPHVCLVEVETKTAWGGGKRLDVEVQWQAAYQEGLLRAQGVQQMELL